MDDPAARALVQVGVSILQQAPAALGPVLTRDLDYNVFQIDKNMDVLGALRRPLLRSPKRHLPLRAPGTLREAPHIRYRVPGKNVWGNRKERRG